MAVGHTGQAVEKSPFGASVLAWLVVAKFERHLPVYRHQEMLLGPLKLWLSRTLLCGLLRSTAGALRPLERRIIEHVLQNNVLQVDETLTRFLRKRLGKAAQGYLFGYAGVDRHRYIFYDFQPNRSREGPEKILANYTGYLQTDGYAVYTGLVRNSQGRLRDAACFAHARRKFDEARYTTSHSLMHEALAWIQQLYDVEDRAAELTADERLTLRLCESAPIVEKHAASDSSTSARNCVQRPSWPKRSTTCSTGGKDSDASSKTDASRSTRTSLNGCYAPSPWEEQISHSSEARTEAGRRRRSTRSCKAPGDTTSTSFRT